MVSLDCQHLLVVYHPLSSSHSIIKWLISQGASENSLFPPPKIDLTTTIYGIYNVYLIHICKYTIFHAVLVVAVQLLTEVLWILIPVNAKFQLI